MVAADHFHTAVCSCSEALKEQHISEDELCDGGIEMHHYLFRSFPVQNYNTTEKKKSLDYWEKKKFFYADMIIIIFLPIQCLS